MDGANKCCEINGPSEQRDMVNIRPGELRYFLTPIGTPDYNVQIKSI